MKKITLNIDALQVTTFVPVPEPGGARGTVRGHDTALCNTAACSPGMDSCGCGPTYYCSVGYNTCDMASCVETCTNPYRPMC